MSVSATLARTGTSTWSLVFTRDSQVLAVGTVERNGGIYNAYASPDEQTRGCELVGSGTDLETAVTGAVHFFIAGLHRPTAHHYAPGADAGHDENLTAIEWST
jgi:hypothetical protein